MFPQRFVSTPLQFRGYPFTLPPQRRKAPLSPAYTNVQHGRAFRNDKFRIFARKYFKRSIHPEYHFRVVVEVSILRAIRSSGNQTDPKEQQCLNTYTHQ